MTNVEIAKRLLDEAKQGRLDREILPHFINSLQFGGPVPDPKAWLEGVAKDLPEFILSSKAREQLLDVAARWNQ